MGLKKDDTIKKHTVEIEPHTHKFDGELASDAVTGTAAGQKYDKTSANGSVIYAYYDETRYASCDSSEYNGDECGYYHVTHWIGSVPTTQYVYSLPGGKFLSGNLQYDSVSASSSNVTAKVSNKKLKTGTTEVPNAQGGKNVSGGVLKGEHLRSDCFCNLFL